MRGCPRCGYVRTTYGDPDVGAKLRRMREKAGLSVAVLSSLSGQPKSTISAIERGERRARRAAVDPIVSAMRRRAEEMREVVSDFEDEASERERPLRVPEPTGEALRGGEPAELPVT